MKPIIIEKKQIKIVGCVSFGGDIHKLWNTFMQYEKQIKHANLDVGYEIQVFDDRFKGGDKLDSEIDFYLPIASK
ncbi:MAG: hypothetical protein HN952_04145 [Candidatus Cloacimonetes bacterium]|jgi:hypothetical protein|nr:hypothetical protein [Candidatus Cloacimonadota bacterium]MBT6994128.1 hypothetical protein [Candidatus Cloacimonadota bacterium]